MTINCDYILVKIDKELNDDLGTIKNEHGEDVRLVLNPNFNPTHHAKIGAEVISAPQYLSGRDYPLGEIHPGSPRPIVYRSSDSIEKALAALPPKYRRTQGKSLVSRYQAGSYEPQMLTHFGAPVEVEVGDIVYFHYNCLINEQNFWGFTDDMQLIYKIHYSQLFCYVRHGAVVMLNNYVLVSEYFDDEIQDIDVNGVAVKAKLKGNLVIQIHDKPRYLLGYLQHIGAAIGPHGRSENLRGEAILYAVGSEFENTIEGQKYWVMRQQDIVAVYCDEKFNNPNAALEFNVLRPVGDYIMVIPEQLEVSNNVKTHVWDQTKNSQEFKQGEIFVLPSAVSQTKKIKKYGRGVVIGLGNTVEDNWLGERIAYEKSSFYMYAEEWQRAFVRRDDVYGTFIKE